MPRGGLRSNPGGRPKGTTGIKQVQTIKKEEARDALRQLVLQKMEQLVDAQLANATGIKYLVRRDAKSGKFLRVTADMLDQQTDDDLIEMWEKEPSVQSFTDLMNRALDKPKEQEQEVTVAGKLVIEIAKGW
jgi:quinol monooxygenase YgiN